MTLRLIATFVLLAVPRATLACPVCFGENDSPLASAMNLGILAMLGVVVAVLAAFGLFIVNLNRRARLFEQSARAERRAVALDAQEGPVSC
jgi:hypothetical protein